MRESRPYGVVRGALSNERPYRDQIEKISVNGIHKKESLDVASQDDSICAGARGTEALSGDGSCSE